MRGATRGLASVFGVRIRSGESRASPVIAKELFMTVSRRDFLATTSAAMGGITLAQGVAHAAQAGADLANLPPYGGSTIPSGIRSRRVPNVNGLTVHMLEAGYE